MKAAIFWESNLLLNDRYTTFNIPSKKFSI